MLDVVRLVRALRPEGINWPVREDGKPTNRLELLTKLNGLEHAHAHDALSDVYATIAVAKMIREKQPKMFEYLFMMRNKNEVKRLVNLDNKRPFVYASGRYPAEYNNTTVAVPLTAGRNGNILVYDLRYSIGELERVLPDFSLPRHPLGAKAPASSVGSLPSPSPAHSSVFPIVKELCFNKCPAVAPITVLEMDDGWEKIGLSREQVKNNLRTLNQHPEFAERMRSEYEKQPEFPPAKEPEMALYDGFLNERDRIKVTAVRNADARKLADFHPEFDDERLPELLLHYKGRNFPESLSESENVKWEEYRRKRLEEQAPKFLEELNKVYLDDEFVSEELKLYFESLFDTEY